MSDYTLVLLSPSHATQALSSTLSGIYDMITTPVAQMPHQTLSDTLYGTLTAPPDLTPTLTPDPCPRYQSLNPP